MRITVENHGPNAQKVYHLVALFTNLEVLLGTVNACLPVMKPVFIKISSSKFSTWLSSVTSGTIVIFVRPSQMGSAWKSSSRSKRNSASKPPLGEEMGPWNPPDKGGDVRIESDETPPLRYMVTRPTALHLGHQRNNDSSLTGPRPPVPPKNGTYNSTKHWQPAEDQATSSSLGIHVERSWDVDREERGESPDDDRQELVKEHRQWG